MHYRRRFILLMALLGVLASIASVASEYLPIILYQNDLSMSAILIALTLISFLISPVAVFVVSYWFGNAIDVPREYKRIALISGVVGAIASIGGPLGFFALNMSVSRTPSIDGFLLIWIKYAIKFGVQFPLVSITGASVAYFQSSPVESKSVLPGILTDRLLGDEGHSTDLDNAAHSSKNLGNREKYDPEPDVEYGQLDCLDSDTFSETYRVRKRTADGPQVVCKRQLTEPELTAPFHTAVKQWEDLSDREGVVPIREYGKDWFERPDYEDDSLGECDRALAEQIDALSTASMTIHRAHEDGVVHGGLTPATVLLDGATVDVSDWAFAQQLAEYTADSAYDAPEQIAGESADLRTDVYRLGAIAYFVGTGQPPDGDPPSELNREVSEQFETVCEKAMATDPDDRYQSVMEFDDMLRWAVFRG